MATLQNLQLIRVVAINGDPYISIILLRVL